MPWELLSIGLCNDEYDGGGGGGGDIHNGITSSVLAGAAIKNSVASTLHVYISAP